MIGRNNLIGYNIHFVMMEFEKFISEERKDLIYLKLEN